MLEDSDSRTLSWMAAFAAMTGEIWDNSDTPRLMYSAKHDAR
jgi:hypothetical protein